MLKSLAEGKKVSLIASRKCIGVGGSSRKASLKTWNTIELTVILYNCTVAQIKRKLAKIQILRLSRNAQEFSWGEKGRSQEKENVSFMTVCFNFFPVQAKKQSVFLADDGSEGTLYANPIS